MENGWNEWRVRFTLFLAVLIILTIDKKKRVTIKQHGIYTYLQLWCEVFLMGYCHHPLGRCPPGQAGGCMAVITREGGDAGFSN